MTPIETVFLDAGGVLVHPNWPRVSGELARRGVQVSAAALEAADPRARRRIDLPATIGATDDRSRGRLYFDLVLAQAGVPPSEATREALDSLDEYHARCNLWEVVPPDVPPALARLRQIGLQLVVVSNANGTIGEMFGRLGLADRVDLLIDSSVEGVEKPDPRLFEIALARSGARRDATVHVGDLYCVDVAGARAAGLRAALLDLAGLYGDADCIRVRTLDELCDRIERREV
ncbi:MAG: HAD-IA family hydrolase [Acidobacteria bacterium]|nr:HAD-IA family hydrolase [Acidobacteriota bacterium]